MSAPAIVFDADGAYWEKDPGASLDVGFDWSEWLVTAQATALDSSVWAAESGISISAPQDADGVTSVLVSGGTIASGKYTDYELTNTIAAGSLVDVRRMRVRVKKT